MEVGVVAADFVHVVGDLEELDGPVLLLVENVVALAEGLEVLGDEAELGTRHLGEGVVLVVEVKPHEEPVEERVHDQVHVGFHLPLEEVQGLQL